VYLVPNKPKHARLLPLVYSEAVRGALHEIRRVHRDEESKLSPADRLDLANALQILAVAGMLEAQLASVGDCPS
jgi:hypothetical protein